MKIKNKSHYVRYGSICMKRAECPSCGDRSFVKNGLSVCCNQKVSFDGIVSTIMESTPSIKRRRSISKIDKLTIRNSQDHKCIYCDNEFGYLYWYKTKLKLSTIHYDHFDCFAYSRNDSYENITASCNICNLLKSNKMFDNLEEARIYLNGRRKEKGYRSERPRVSRK